MALLIWHILYHLNECQKSSVRHEEQPSRNSRLLGNQQHAAVDILQDKQWTKLKKYKLFGQIKLHNPL